MALACSRAAVEKRGGCRRKSSPAHPQAGRGPHCDALLAEVLPVDEVGVAMARPRKDCKHSIAYYLMCRAPISPLAHLEPRVAVSAMPQCEVMDRRWSGAPTPPDHGVGVSTTRAKLYARAGSRRRRPFPRRGRGRVLENGAGVSKSSHCGIADTATRGRRRRGKHKPRTTPTEPL